MTQADAAIYFHPEAYSIAGEKLMGRHAAGNGFLRAYFRHGTGTRLMAQVDQAAHGDAFQRLAHDAGRQEPVEIVGKENLGDLKASGTVYLPGPGIGAQARLRSFWGHDAWSLCGITHTTANQGTVENLTALATDPVQPWDALICTSNAVKANVEYLLDRQEEYLAERLGATQATRPMLPVIPLGVHTDDFSFDADAKGKARQTLGVPIDAVVVLYLGRLSFHAKAHPLPMYLALERAAQETGKSVYLVECGWHGNAAISKAFEEAAEQGCPSVRRLFLDGREPANRDTAWAAADIFCSLPDNIQETFGITPLEAMSAGLPLVVSDWDGYKDTVRDGVDGFRVPTLMPEQGLGADLARRHALNIDSYDRYIGYTSMSIAVDVEAATRAFVSLFLDPDLRRQMGAAGRARAIATYDWAQIIPQYEQLWVKMTHERRHARGAAQHNKIWPAYQDPFCAFAGYSTEVLKPSSHLQLADPDVSRSLSRAIAFSELAAVNYASAVLPSKQDIRVIVECVAETGPGSVQVIADALSLQSRNSLKHWLIWLVKMGILHREQ